MGLLSECALRDMPRQLAYDVRCMMLSDSCSTAQVRNQTVVLSDYNYPFDDHVDESTPQQTT